MPVEWLALGRGSPGRFLWVLVWWAQAVLVAGMAAHHLMLAFRPA